jgi:pilus assembly protein FimV
MARETQGSAADERKLEQYGVWVKVKPRDVTAPVLDESFELSDLESPSAARAPAPSAAPAAEDESESTLTAEEEQLLDELETELEPEAASEGGDLAAEEGARGGAPAVLVPEEEPLLADSELPDIETASRSGSSDLEMAEIAEEELPELEEEVGAAPSPASEPSEVEVPLSEGVAEEESFDDLAALETELATVTTRTRDAAGSAAAPSASGSAEILARIEDELKSIRADLNQLRADLSGLRRSAARSGGKGQAAEPGIKGGFLDEDEDETIALTGDELDNILNTAQVTEEVADADAGPGADLAAEAPAEEASGDILGYETPAPEPVEEPVEELEEEVAEPVLAEGEASDDTLALSDDELLPTDVLAPAAEELPSDLVLEEIPLEESSEPSFSPETLPEIDLEGIPEIEAEPAEAKTREGTAAEEESETIDLETLDLGEEPKVIEAVPEQVEEVAELDSEEVLEAEEVPAEQAAPDKELPEVDLEALAAEAEDLEEEVPEAPVVEDLEIGELEAVSDETPEESPQKEIEISFEGDLGEETQVREGPSKASEEAEEVLEAEEIEEAEEVSPSGSVPEPAAAETSAIPDNLKDEIRTVLKYMDHLLEALPDEKIQEFASSDYFVMYKKLFEDLGLGE